jgi:hypothetical protein
MTALAIDLPGRRTGAVPTRAQVERRHEMTGDTVPPGHDGHRHPGLDARRGTMRLDPNALIQGLERLRECVGRRLEDLETLARERVSASPTAADPPEPQGLLQRRIAEFEEAQRSLREQADRREREWREALEQLEADRQLLAEAWDRLERERIESPAAAQVQAPAGGRAAAVDRVAIPTALPEPHDPDGDHVAHAILKQFQALRNDVRRNAGQRGPV